MNPKKYAENRVRGWFPRELFGLSLEVDVYSEYISAGKFVKTMVGSISLLALIVLTVAAWFSISIGNPLFAVIFAFPLIFLLMMYANYRGLKIKITSKELIIRYGFLNHKRVAI